MNTPFVDVLAQEIPPEKQEKFFVKPPHIDRLISPKSAIIIGERGCGKTTVLKYLEECFNKPEKEFEYIGIYHRFETARYKALVNPDFSENQNIRVFSQAISSILMKQLCTTLCEIKRNRSDVITNEKEICSRICHLVEADNTDSITTFDKLGDLFEYFRSKTAINSLNDNWVCYFDYSTLLATFCMELRKQKGFNNTCFCVLFDELENLSISQQKVINSFIKGATYYLTYKVCMRPDGFLTSNTLAQTEDIREIDDYEEINYVNDIIGKENEVTQHLKEICANRIKYFYEQENVKYTTSDLDIEEYLQIVTNKEEVESWERVSEYKDNLLNELMVIYPNRRNELSKIDDVIKLRLIKVLYDKEKNEQEIFANLIDETDVYKNWMHNYKVNIMYLIASECEQEKKYCGFKAFIKLANSNTRRILEILHYAFGDYNNDRKPYKSINIEKQTYAVNKLSKSYFDQINKIPYTGNKVKNLAFSLGSLFARNMKDGRIRKFEVNSFAIVSTHTLSDEQRKELDMVLHDSIVWGVLLPFQANKIKNRGEMVLDGRDLVLHPLLSPYFKFSYRKRQKTELMDYVVYAMFGRMTNREIGSVSNEINTKYVQGTLWGCEDGII